MADRPPPRLPAAPESEPTRPESDPIRSRDPAATEELPLRRGGEDPAAIPEYVEEALTSTPDRWRELTRRYPLPVDRNRFVFRTLGMDGKGLVPLKGRLPGTIGPGSVIRTLSDRVGKRLPEHRFNELLERLWTVEEEQARTYQRLVDRQNELRARARADGKLLTEVEAWVVRYKDLLVLRAGEDEEHARHLGLLRKLDEEAASLVDRYIEKHAE